MKIGLVGKPNVGKSTFFKAATLKDVPIADYPFTTIDPNLGVAYARVACPEADFHVKCTPVHGACVNGTRFVPIDVVDVAGLVKDAHKGRGLGNKFLDDLRQADAFLHVLDASGGTNEEGQSIPVGTHDPATDVAFLEEEIDWWITGILNKDWLRLTKKAESAGEKIDQILKAQLTGLGVTDAQLHAALRQAPIDPNKPSGWGDAGIFAFAQELRRISKPSLLVLNKADKTPPTAMAALEGKLEGRLHMPASGDAEIALRAAARVGLIDYAPGGPDFSVKEPTKLNPKQHQALDYIREHALKPYGSTGVLQAIEKAAFDLLKLIVVFPVEDDHKLTDKKGNVLPDAHFLPQGATARDLAYKVHTDLGKHFIRAVDCRQKRAIGAEHVLQHRDVVRIVSDV
ncbi:MAG TPA: redox-regulated ATPase YchF [Candidatus Thermoplasmatota archaeon]|nr:redox-regulated ATPase YchF [Candidatus Thermoplasmatota archaeon]